MDDYFVSASPVQQVAPPAPQQPAAPSRQAYGAPPPWVQPTQPFGPPGMYAPAPQGKSTAVKVLIGLAIGIGAFVVLGILAAIAIPVFLNERGRSEAAHTTVGIPASVAGLPRLSDAQSATIEHQLAAVPLPGDHLAGVFGNGSTRIAVSVTKHFMSYSDQRDYISGAEHGAQGSGMDGTTFTTATPGKLGGQMQCGTYQGRVTTCFFADAGVYGAVIVFNAGGNPAAVARQAREAVEHRS